MDKHPVDPGIKPGNDWPQTLQDAIDNCKAIIVVLTPQYLNSDICRNELIRAAGRNGISVFPIIKNEFPKNKWPIEIQGKQAVFFTKADNYNINLASLRNSIQLAFSSTLLSEEEIIYLNILLEEIKAKMGVLEYTSLDIEGQKNNHKAYFEPADEWGFSYLKKKEANEKPLLNKEDQRYP